MKSPIERREFGKAILSSAFSAAAAAQSPQKILPRRPWPPGIKISVQMPTDPSADLQFVNQQLPLREYRDERRRGGDL